MTGFSLICEACGHGWTSEYMSDHCPDCGSCSHYFELARGDCSWCFGGRESCANCAAEIQNHEPGCPFQPEEDRPRNEILAGTINLKAWRMENRRQPFGMASSYAGVHLTPSARSGWEYAVWVEKDAPEEARKVARNIVECSRAAFASGLRN